MGAWEGGGGERGGKIAHRGLHGEQGQDLQQVVLDDVADDAVLVKVSAAPLRAEVLAEDHLRAEGPAPRPFPPFSLPTAMHAVKAHIDIRVMRAASPGSG